MIFKNEYYYECISGIAMTVATTSINGAKSIIGLWDIIENDFYKTSINDFVEEINKNLGSTEFLNEYQFSQNYYSEIESKNFTDLVFAFYKYYQERLPMLRCMKLKNLNKRLGKKEIEHIMIQSFNYLGELHPDVIKRRYSYEDHSFKEHYKNNQLVTVSLVSGNILRKHVDYVVYSSDSLRNEIEEIYPEKKLATNINQFAFTVFTDSFPIYYDALSKAIGESLFSAVNLGYIVGTKTTEEVCSELE